MKCCSSKVSKMFPNLGHCYTWYDLGIFHEIKCDQIVSFKDFAEWYFSGHIYIFQLSAAMYICTAYVCNKIDLIMSLELYSTMDVRILHPLFNQV